MTNKRDKKYPNRPPDGERWIWQTAELLVSPAWRGMTINARRVLDRIMVEQTEHKGSENGNLIVRHVDFIEAGVSANFIADAIDELTHLRLISVKRGRGGGGTGLANTFLLTWLPEKGSHFCDDIWKRTSTEDVIRWRDAKRKLAGKRRAKKMPASAKQGFKKTKPHSRISEWPTNGTVSENGQNGNKVLQLMQIPTHGSVSTLKTLQGFTGRSHPTAQAKGEPTCKKNHTQLADIFGSDGWSVLMGVSSDTVQDLLSKLAAGTIDAGDIADARLEASRSNQTASQQ